MGPSRPWSELSGSKLRELWLFSKKLFKIAAKGILQAYNEYKLSVKAGVNKWNFFTLDDVAFTLRDWLLFHARKDTYKKQPIHH